jgi:hypothetical protein
MVLTTALARVIVDASKQLVGMLMPAAAAALVGLARKVADVVKEADTGAGSVTVTDPVPEASTPLRHEVL